MIISVFSSRAFNYPHVSMDTQEVVTCLPYKLVGESLNSSTEVSKILDRLYHVDTRVAHTPVLQLHAIRVNVREALGGVYSG